MKRRQMIAMLGFALLTGACMQSGGGEGPATPGLAAGKLSGSVAYRQRSALPPTAVVEVSILDVAKMDAPARSIATTRIPTEGRQVPIPFELSYPADRPGTHADYAVQARIEDGNGRLLFITDTRNALPESGRIDLMLVPAG